MPTTNTGDDALRTCAVHDLLVWLNRYFEHYPPPLNIDFFEFHAMIKKDPAEAFSDEMANIFVCHVINIKTLLQTRLYDSHKIGHILISITQYPELAVFILNNIFNMHSIFLETIIGRSNEYLKNIDIPHVLLLARINSHDMNECLLCPAIDQLLAYLNQSGVLPACMQCHFIDYMYKFGP